MISSRVLLVVLLVAYLLTGGAAEGGVLCFEPDGRVVVEMGEACDETAASDGLVPRPDDSDSASSAEADHPSGCKCTDIPLPTTSVGKPADVEGARRVSMAAPAALRPLVAADATKTALADRREPAADRVPPRLSTGVTHLRC